MENIFAVSFNHRSFCGGNTTSTNPHLFRMKHRIHHHQLQSSGCMITATTAAMNADPRRIRSVPIAERDGVLRRNISGTKHALDRTPKHRQRPMTQGRSRNVGISGEVFGAGHMPREDYSRLTTACKWSNPCSRIFLVFALLCKLEVRRSTHHSFDEAREFLTLRSRRTFLKCCCC